ncbi:MAG: hypothetical protein LQ343_003674 [Gyalolechia ehrenbergii]|nr:MAG: hypothetical protein LQ343_003674 [Gyalolechia ehrenbergii]
MQIPRDRSPIQPLPQEVAAQIKSSRTISSLEHVTIGLVQNSMDAGATRIDVSVDFARGACTVEDDGWGISPEEFLDDGGLGKAYRTYDPGIWVRSLLMWSVDTSKLNSRNNVHGGEGTFLASLAATAILTITSHHYANRSAATLIYHHTRPAARLVPAPPHYQLLHRAHGTKVEVHDLFGNMPVRIKQRESALTDKKEFVREWESLQKSLVGLILAWQLPIHLVLKTSVAHRKLTLRPRTMTEHDGSKVDQRTPKSLDISWVCSLLSQAGYIEPDGWDTWTKTSARTPFMTILGVFSLQPVESKRIQFISLGIRHLRVDSGASVLYDAVNHVFALSSFGNLEESLDGKIDEKTRSKDRRYKKDGHTTKQLRGAGKGIDRWPMFVIRIEIQAPQEDPSRSSGGRDILEQESTLSSIIKVLTAMTTGFLGDHHFRPRASRKRRRPTSGSNTRGSTVGRELSQATRETPDTALMSTSQSENARSRSKLRSRSGDVAFTQDLLGSTVRIPVTLAGQDRYIDEVFRNWSRIKTGTTRGANLGFLTDSDQRKKSEKGQEPSIDMNREDPLTRGGSGLSIPTALAQLSNHKPSAMDNSDVGQGNQISSLAAKDIVPASNTEDTIPWTNPITKDTVWINTRTGLAVSCLQRPRTTATENNPLVDGGSPSIKDSLPSHRLARCTSAPTLPNAGSWVSNFLKEWENPVFAPAKEQDIPQVSFEGIGLDNSSLTPGKRNMWSHLNLENAYSDASSALSAKLSKASLAQAKVISQVDKKFILALMQPSHPNPTGQIEQSTATDDQQILVLIDQHAADERIRVENLLADLCTKPSPETISNMSAIPHKPAIATALLPKPLVFQIKPQEHRLFITQAEHFANWGILYDLSPHVHPKPPRPSSAGMTQPIYKISVKALPPVIAERCRQEPKLLIDLLRKDIWKREEDGCGSSTPATTAPLLQRQRAPHLNASGFHPDEDGDDDGKRDWLKRISTCPRGILDMLNSRSCRSAIMFNDELSKGECETLVGRLAGCRFPFQCAHGRPSLVPLVGLGGRNGRARGGGGAAVADGDGRRGEEAGRGGGRGGGEGKGKGMFASFGVCFGGNAEEGGEDFMTAWKRWTGK